MAVDRLEKFLNGIVSLLSAFRPGQEWVFGFCPGLELGWVRVGSLGGGLDFKLNYNWTRARPGLELDLARTWLRLDED